MENQIQKKSKLRIGIFSWESMHSFRVGGLAQAVSDLSKALAEKGHEVHLFTRINEGGTDYEKIDGVNYHKCSFPYSENILELSHNMCKSMVDRFHATKEMVGEFDLVHGHDWVVVDALHELKNEGYPTMLTFHSTEYGRNGGTFGDWWEFKEISGKEWYGSYIADKVTTVSSTMKGELIWLYDVPDWKVEVVSNGGNVQESKKEVDPGRIKERYNIPPLAPMILYVGRMEYQKGPDLLVEAAPHILRHRPDAKILMVGKGGMRDYLENRARELNVTDSIKFLGYVSDEERKDTLNASDIVCIPSRNEPFGLVLFEAWDAEKAVVATDVGGLRENIDNFVNGIKVYTYPESIAWGIKYIIDDPEGVKHLGKKGKEKLKESTWQKQASKYEKIYKGLLEETEK